jgi:HlyD family secretion protein
VSSAIGTVSNGTTLATLADLTDLRVIGQLDESQVGSVRAGQEVTFRVDAYPSRTFTGRVHRVSPLGEQDSSVVVFDVEILVTDPEASLLRSGMSADAEIVTSHETNVIAVPLAAIRSRPGVREVVRWDGTAQAIETGASDGERIVVESGLSEGDVIVADALSVREAAPEHASSGLLPRPPSSGARGGGRP